MRIATELNEAFKSVDSGNKRDIFNNEIELEIYRFLCSNDETRPDATKWLNSTISPQHRKVIKDEIEIIKILTARKNMDDIIANSVKTYDVSFGMKLLELRVTIKLR